jgi:hypothetical protein
MEQLSTIMADVNAGTLSDKDAHTILSNRFAIPQ